MTEEKKIDNGGPMFPVVERQEHLDRARVCHEWGGLTKREWFAGMALQGLLLFPESTQMMGEVVRRSYEFADAMLKESDKK